LSAALKLSGPTTKRFKSVQVVSTPWGFIHAVEEKFGLFAWDLAATEDNAKAPDFISPERDTFSVDWAELLAGGLGWLNPEFDPMKKWVAKCALEQQRKARFLTLSPASVGSNWFWTYVQPFATVYCLTPRIVFEGSTDPYPKDLILSHYNQNPNHELQRWKWK
jgi:hypothetical protein